MLKLNNQVLTSSIIEEAIRHQRYQLSDFIEFDKPRQVRDWIFDNSLISSLNYSYRIDDSIEQLEELL